MKTLYYIPMVHSSGEFGSLEESITKAQTKVYGKDQLEKLRERIGEYWDEVNKRVAAAGLYSSKAASAINIFVDGLPNVEEKIVCKVVGDLVVSRTIPAYQIVARLMRHGAKVHGTEDAKLLLEEYQYYKDLSNGSNGDTEKSQERLVARDIAIASRIQEVMASDGDVGIIFIGRSHDVVGKLPDEFTVIIL